MKEAYIIMKIGYEYNDEYNYCNDRNSGYPQAIFFNKESAEAERYNIEVMCHKDQDISEYEPSEFINNEDKFDSFLGEMLEKYGSPGKDRWGYPKSKYALIEKMNDEEVKKYMSFFHTHIFTTVQKVKIDEQDFRDTKINSII